MNDAHLNAFRRSFSAVASRRGALAGLAGALLTAGEVRLGESDAEAKKNRKRKQRKYNRNKKPSNPVRVDAICPGPTDGGGFFLTEGSLFAQTYTALSSGRLEIAELFIEVNSTGSADLTLQLRDVDGSGAPSDEVLAETSLDVSDVPLGQFSIYFAFADSPPIEANQEYALVLSRSGSRSVSWKSHRGDTCAGRMFRRDAGSAQFEVPIDDLDLILTTIISS